MARVRERCDFPRVALPDIRESGIWTGGRAVECSGLENRQTFTGLVGSNPTLSVRFARAIRACAASGDVGHAAKTRIQFRLRRPRQTRGICRSKSRGDRVSRRVEPKSRSRAVVDVQRIAGPPVLFQVRDCGSDLLAPVTEGAARTARAPIATTRSVAAATAIANRRGDRSSRASSVNPTAVSSTSDGIRKSTSRSLKGYSRAADAPSVTTSGAAKCIAVRRSRRHVIHSAAIRHTPAGTASAPGNASCSPMVRAICLNGHTTLEGCRSENGQKPSVQKTCMNFRVTGGRRFSATKVDASALPPHAHTMVATRATASRSRPPPLQPRRVVSRACAFRARAPSPAAQSRSGHRWNTASPRCRRR